MASPYQILGTMIPFGILAVLEALSLRAAGPLVAEWMLPGLTVIGVVLITGSLRVMRLGRAALVMLAIFLWVDGNLLLARNYVTQPRTRHRTSVATWYTPLTGMRRVIR